MYHRLATLADLPLLADLNRQLTEDEQHRNRFHDRVWFEERMRSFLSGTYQAVLFSQAGGIVAYALFCPEGQDTIYLRQIFVVRQCRRQGIGKAAVAILQRHYWPADKRVAVGVLVGNSPAIGLYRSLGFHDYALELELLPARA